MTNELGDMLTNGTFTTFQWKSSRTFKPKKRKNASKSNTDHTVEQKDVHRRQW